MELQHELFVSLLDIYKARNLYHTIKITAYLATKSNILEYVISISEKTVNANGNYAKSVLFTLQATLHQKM